MKTAVFIKKILAYKTKEKDNAVMQMVADRLGEEEINSLALYLSKTK
jgi:cytochrome c553